MAIINEVKLATKQEVLDYQWGVLNALVGGYVCKNRVGELTAWGMLLDAYDMKGDQSQASISYELIENRIGLRTVIEKIGCGATLIDLACDLFIKREGR